MPEILLAPPKTSSTQASYSQLREQVRLTLARGRQHAEALVEKEKTRTYWQIGRLIDRHIRREKKTESERAQYGKHVVEKLSHDLGINQRYLYYSLNFSRTYPILPARAKLTWRHYRGLLLIKDEAKRLALTKEAEKGNWSTRTLEAKIAGIKSGGKIENGTRRKNEKPSQKLIPKRGSLFTYRIVNWAAKSGEKPDLRLDLGFMSYKKIPVQDAKLFKDKDLVEGRTLPKLKNLPQATKADLFTYEAKLERVVDADTVWLRIDSGFEDFSFRKKLRLRGIDAPELGTQAGERAKKFVESELKAATEIIVTTTKPDKWDRYLTDFYYRKENREEIFLNKLLLDHGLARLKADYTPKDWGE